MSESSRSKEQTSEGVEERVELLRRQQALAICRILEERRIGFTLEPTASGGWLARLADGRESHGAEITDALAQLAQAVAFE